MAHSPLKSVPLLDGLDHYLGIVPQDICEKTGLANVHWEDPNFIVAPTIDTDQSLGFWACKNIISIYADMARTMRRILVISLNLHCLELTFRSFSHLCL